MAVKQRRNKNGQIEYYDDSTGSLVNSDGTSGTNTKESTLSLNKKTSTPKKEEKKTTIKDAVNTTKKEMGKSPYTADLMKYASDNGTKRNWNTYQTEASDQIKQMAKRYGVTIDESRLNDKSYVKSIIEPLYKGATDKLYSADGGSYEDKQSQNWLADLYKSTFEIDNSNVNTASNKIPGGAGKTNITPTPLIKPVEPENTTTEEIKKQVSNPTNNVKTKTKEQELTDEQNDILKNGAKTSKDERPVELNEEARKLVQELKKGYYDIDDKYIEGIPMGIIEAYKQGRFGNPDSDNAKTARNYLIANSFINALGNIGNVIKGKDKTDSMWESNIKKNFDESNNRRNEKFTSQMKNEMGLINDGSKMSLQLDNDINKMFQDNVMGLAAKKANNLEDQLGMLYIYQKAGDHWKTLSNDDKWALLGAQQALRTGDTQTAEQYMNHFSREELATLGIDLRQMQNELQQYQNMSAYYKSQMDKSDASYRDQQNAAGINVQNASAKLTNEQARSAGIDADYREADHILEQSKGYTDVAATVNDVFNKWFNPLAGMGK